MFLFTMLWFYKFNSDFFFMHWSTVETQILNEFTTQAVVIRGSDKNVIKEEGTKQGENHVKPTNRNVSSK